MELLGYFVNAITPINLLLALVGVVLGTIIGALPGLSATMAVAVLVPFTFTMEPASGLIALGAIYTGAIYGGAYAAILVNTPGTPSSIATTFDGYPMAKRGDGGLAVSIATIASVVGGLVGAISLLLLAPPLAKVALNFGPPEYFWLAIFGLTLISALSVGNTLKGLIGACIGLLMSVVGVAVVGGDVRYTMDMQALLGGFDVTSALIGLFCIPVIIDLVATRDPHLKITEGNQGIRLTEAVAVSLREKFNLVRSSIIGTVVGILPGAGGSIAGLVSYSEARRSSKESNEYGKGHPGGIIATEAANNATVGGGFIPTLVLGIPGTPPDAIILGALLVQGIKIGPTLFNSQGNIVYTFIFGLLIATLIMLPVGLLIGRYAYRSIINVPKAILVPTIAFMVIIGSYSIHSDVHDTYVMLILGALAWILERFGFAASPIVLGLILGKIAEQGFVQAYLIGNATQNVTGMFFGRPISLLIIVAAALTLFYPLIAARITPKKALDVELPASAEEEPRPEKPAKYRDPATIAIALVLILIGGLAIAGTSDMSPLGSVFPTTISIAMIVFCVLLILINLLRPAAQKVNTVGQSGVASPSNRRRLLVAALLAAWIIAIPILGLGVASFLGFISVTAVANHEDTSLLRAMMYGLVAAVIVGLFYLLMANVLLIRMPMGLFF
ncbi:MAG: tripartite tricarboxylate transporter permease [Hyphomicrobiaceae bacterium]|nr:tripartite tricarboxylate transporter permease [Hyphomicrobiaceae bacterium]MCC0009253.1 tripartite tricarboxylate transporter permease [Hyphomicrobiaceae bacterium]